MEISIRTTKTDGDPFPSPDASTTRQREVAQLLVYRNNKKQLMFTLHEQM